MPHDLAVDDLFLSERQRAQRLREQLERLDAHGHLAGARAEQRPRHADDVAEVEMLDDRITIVAERVLPEVQLDAPRLIGEVRERRLAVRAPRHDATGDPHRPGPRRPRGSAANASLALCVRANPYANGATPSAASASSFSRRARMHEVELLAHAAASPPAPNRLRYASMNGSMSPSITLLHVGDLQLRPVVVDHRVRLEDVAPDLAAERDVGLRRSPSPPSPPGCCSTSAW